MDVFGGLGGRQYPAGAEYRWAAALTGCMIALLGAMFMAFGVSPEMTGAAIVADNFLMAAL